MTGKMHYKKHKKTQKTIKYLLISNVCGQDIITSGCSTPLTQIVYVPTKIKVSKYENRKLRKN